MPGITLAEGRGGAGLRDVRLHGLRHSDANVGVRQGEAVPVIGKPLGHADPETTLKYTHSSDAMAVDAADTVGAILGG